MYVCWCCRCRKPTKSTARARCGLQCSYRVMRHCAVRYRQRPSASASQACTSAALFQVGPLGNFINAPMTTPVASKNFRSGVTCNGYITAVAAGQSQRFYSGVRVLAGLDGPTELRGRGADLERAPPTGVLETPHQIIKY
jgi:hypothetical protein